MEPDLLAGLVELLANASGGSARARRAFARLRIAATSREIHEFEQYMLKEYGYSVSRIKNVPLVQEDEPDAPELRVLVPARPGDWSNP